MELRAGQQAARGEPASFHFQGEPDRPRPVRSGGYPLTPLVVGAVSLPFLLGSLWSDRRDSLLALALVAVCSLPGLLQPLPATEAAGPAAGEQSAP